MVSGSGTAEIKSEGGNHYLQLTRNTTSADGYLHANFGPTVRDFDYSLRVKVTEYKSEDWNWGKSLFRSQNTENESYICELWGWRANLVCKSVSQKNRGSHQDQGKPERDV